MRLSPGNWPAMTNTPPSPGTVRPIMVGLFGALSGFLANFFLVPAKEDAATHRSSASHDSILMLNELEARFTTELATIRDALASSATDVKPAVNSDTNTDAG